jgi:hypothetical protein
MIRKVLVIALAAVLLTPNLHSQGTLTSNWIHSWGGTGTDADSAIATDSFGNAYVVGSTTSFGAGGQDVLLLKYDASGNLLWTRTWGGSGNDYGNGVLVGPDGSVYVVGGTSSFGAGWYDVLLLKLDTSGNLIWSRTWGGASYDVGHDLSFDANGNLAIAAEAYSFCPGSCAVLLTATTNGDFVGSRAWKGPATYDSAYSITVDPAGNRVLTGISWDYSVSPNHNTISILKFDSQGNLLWNRNWTGPSEDESWGSKTVRTDAQGNIYVAGRTTANCTSSDFSTCNFDVLLLKIDSNGNLLWARKWGDAGWDSASALWLDSGNSIVIAGINTVSAPGPVQSALIQRYDASGNLIASKVYFDSTASALNSVAQLPPGTFVATGSAPDARGFWDDTGIAAVAASGSLSSPAGSVSSPSGYFGTPAGTTMNPMGVIDVGGGGTDAITSSFSFGPSNQLGTISVSTNLSAAAFTIVGPTTVAGTGTSAMFASVPVGTYTITFGAVSGYVTPPSQTKTFTIGTLTFSAAYSPASLPPPIIRTLSPDHTSRGQTKQIQILGSSFQSGAKVSFSGTGITVINVQVTSANEIDVSINLTSDAQTDSHDVSVLNPDGQLATMIQGFSVLKRAVIVLPGIMGSNLWSVGSKELWFNSCQIIQDILADPCDTFLLQLGLSKDGISPSSSTSSACSQHGVAGVRAFPLDMMVDDIPQSCLPPGQSASATDKYSKLLASLANDYYVKPFPWDWRLDENRVATTAADQSGNVSSLSAVITSVRKAGYDGVDIVAHSQGGLIVREYLQSSNDAALGTVIFLGTPHKGATQSFGILAGWEKIIDAFGGVAPQVNFSTGTAIARHFNSIYELLPRYNFYQPLGSPSREQYSTTYNRLSTLTGEDVSSFVKNAQQVWSQIEGGGNSFRAYQIDGTGHNTLRGFYELVKGGDICIIGNNDPTGDGTVPTISSSLGATVPIFYVNQAHADLPNDPKVIDLVTTLLRGGSATSQGLIGGSYQEISTCSPVLMTANDVAGNMTGLNSQGKILTDIPNSTFVHGSSNESLVLPDGESHAVNLRAIDNGSFTLTIDFADGNSQVVSTSEFDNIPISVNSNATLTVTNSGVPLLLALDIDGDGKTDYVLSPNTTPASSVYISALLDIIRSYGLPHGPQTDLSSVLNAALASFARGDSSSEEGQIHAFERKVQAKMGHELTSDQASVLLRLASFAEAQRNLFQRNSTRNSTPMQ